MKPEHIMRTLPLIAAAASLSLAAGCAVYPSQVDSRFGASVMNARASQVVDPAAAARARAQSLDGVAAVAAADAYKKSFETPPAPVNVFNIGIGNNSR
jgi:hypothetical protein